MNKKKSQILEAAKKLFATKGFNDTSVADIITLANVSKGTFYKYFPSKNACMMAILQDIHDQSVSERKIIAHFNNPSDIYTLEKELICHFNIIINSNIMDMMISSLNNKDEHEEIYEMIRTKNISELYWLGQRLIDIYGTRAKNNAYDCAVMILGSLQQLSIIRSIIILCQMDLAQNVKQVLKMVEPIIFSGQINHEPLLSESFLLNEMKLETVGDKPTYEEIILEFEAFYEEYKKDFDKKNEAYTKILLDTLKNEQNNYFLIESLAFSFIKSFYHTEMELEAFRVYQQVERFLIK